VFVDDAADEVQGNALDEPVDEPVDEVRGDEAVDEAVDEAEAGSGVDLVELALVSVDLSPEGLQPATGTVSLMAVESGGRLDIVMARGDAVLVQEALSGTSPGRPRTHDLLLAAVSSLSAAVSGITLVERRPGGVYVATVGILRPDGSVAELDARPSDALNVALRSPGAALRAARSLVDIPAN